jgi:DNA topoisomerase I
MAAPEPIVELAQDCGLVYVNDNVMPGFSRKRAGAGFAYYQPDGSLIKDKATIQRIKKLAIPPAYTKVWICPLENGHIQATGRDARGRKQYRYHATWLEITNGNKFSRMLSFGSALPRIRERVEADLSKPGIPREKALATVVWLLEKSLIRVGNEEYAKENNSYGLTTMRMRHVSIEGSTIEFKFKGKRGIKHLIKINDRRMAGILRQIQDLPGQELFHYIDDDGQVCTINSSDVNAYLREVSGEDFTAKDFRTWTATVMALAALSNCCGFSTKKEAQRAMKAALAVVSEQLGNTPAICKKSYVHPMILSSFADGSLEEFLKARAKHTGTANEPIDNCAETVVLELLQKLDKERSLPNAA